MERSKLLPACHLRILIKLWLKILRKNPCDKHRNDLLKRTKGSWYHLTSLPFLCMCSQGGFLTLRRRTMDWLIFSLCRAQPPALLFALGVPSISCLVTIYLFLSILHLSAHSSNPLSCLSTLDRLLNDCFRNGTA